MKYPKRTRLAPTNQGEGQLKTGMIPGTARKVPLTVAVSALTSDELPASSTAVISNEPEIS